MNFTEVNIWGIHGGRTGDADSLFLDKDCIAIGWAQMGDLGTLAADREAFKARVAQTYPEKKPGAVPVNAGQLFRFVHEMKSGDIVVYPSKRDRQVHVGRVEGGYKYDPSTEPSYPDLSYHDARNGNFNLRQRYHNPTRLTIAWCPRHGAAGD